MKELFVVASIFLALAHISYADIFSKGDTSSYTIDSAISEDKTGFYYRGGLDYRPQVPAEEPEVRYSILSASKGCSGFDFASSFKNAFNEQILTDYLKGLFSSAMAAAPMLLLEYVSPTLADIDSALRDCKEHKDPFAFLKDVNGMPLSQGGKIDVCAQNRRIFTKILSKLVICICV